MAISESEKEALRVLYLGQIHPKLLAYCHMTRLIAEALEHHSIAPFAMKERAMINLGIMTQPWLDCHGITAPDIDRARLALQRLAEAFHALKALDENSHEGSQFLR